MEDEVLFGQLMWAVILSAFNMGLFAGLDARREGRSFLVWFLVGLLLAPFGLLVWLFFRNNRPPQANAGEPCTTCETPVREGQNYCGSCGAPRTVPDAIESARAGAPKLAPAEGGAARRYTVLTALSRAAARNPGLDLGDLVERARSARTRADFDAIEKDLAARASSEAPRARQDGS